MECENYLVMKCIYIIQINQDFLSSTFHRFVIWKVVLVYEKLSQSKLYSDVDVSSLDLFDVSLLEMFLPNRTVDDNTIWTIFHVK
jgi:hypothetical protein